jgi:uncharacterized protein YyaL (SSP411 family)
MIYTKDFLLQAYAYRFAGLGDETYNILYEQAHRFYDQVGKDKFRVYASLSADAIKTFMEELKKY